MEFLSLYIQKPMECSLNSFKIGIILSIKNTELNSSITIVAEIQCLI